jgi:pimeloyl-ACP methyl ester carboxylesterase
MKYGLKQMSMLLSASLAFSCVALFAEDVKLLDPKPLTAGHVVVTLFPPGHPALKALTGFDQEEKFTKWGAGVGKVENIHNPSIELYLAPPEKANGMSVILSAGGGNSSCNVGPEGVDIAAWLNSLGVSCFVHRYRLKPYSSAIDALADTQRAVRTVRARAKEWNIDPTKIGHMGFSAGGEQTARLALNFNDGKPDAADPIDRISSRPDWTVLVYPGWVPGTLDVSTVPKNVPPNIYGNGQHAGGISARKGIPFGTWQYRLIDWAIDLKLMPAPKKRNAETGEYEGN